MLTANTAYGELIKMIKQEFFKILKSPKSLLTYILICAISIGDSVYAILNSGESGMFGNSHPVMVSLFSAQTTVITRIAFFWVMPVYLMLFYADKYAVEKSCKMTNVYFVKTERRKYFLGKTGCAFFSVFTMFAIPFLINFAINCIFLHGNTSFFDMENWQASERSGLLNISLAHPYLTYLCYILSALVIYGMLCIMCQSIAMIFGDNRVAYVLSFAIWMMFYSSRGLTINHALQPFCEGVELSSAISAFSLFGVTVFAFTAAAYIKTVIKNEI